MDNKAVRNHLPASQRGFSITELMIASTISLMILAGVSGLFVAGATSERTNATVNELTVNGRYAIDTLRRELMAAGFRGISWSEPIAPTTSFTISNDCATGFSSNLRQGIWASNDSNPFSASCLPTASYSRGDLLVVRYVSPSAANSYAAATALSTTTLYLRSAYEQSELFVGSTPPSGTAAYSPTREPWFDYSYQVSTYYVSPFTTSASESPLVPALYRLSLGAGPALAAQLVAPNVEDMQLQFERLTTDLNSRFYDPDDVSSTATSTTTTVTEWDDVVAVRVWLLMRASRTENGYTNTNTYTLGDQTRGPFNDGYRREVFSTLIQLRNS
ncbi:MAG: PilW family protein [Rhodocyclales bacterium]|nr:PilW family protein [Rhodocyclales bacterium]